MPRRAREKCATGIYHIMFRGANRQEIFHDEEFNEIISDDKCLDDEQNKKLNESEARLEIIKIVKNPANIKSLPKRERDRIISEIKKIEGISKRQISRVLGISMGVITKA